MVAIPTVTNNVVESNRVLTVSLAPSASYTTGKPSNLSVTITSSVLPTLTITSNMSTVSQGGAATFTITADQAPVMDTSVNFSVQGTAVPGQNYVPLVGTPCAGGAPQVTVMLHPRDQRHLRAHRHDRGPMAHQGGPGLREGRCHSAAPGEAMLSLTESDLTVTLQASAADRSKLAVGQHCTVQIAGETNEGSGTITELDATPTVLSSGGAAGASQVYEGKIEVSDLTGADGSQVSINVVDQQVNDALTVPIAAVKQNGSGVDVVRVIDLGKGGRSPRCRCTTGLTEGSYIQITKGLQLGELVIAGADQSQ